MLTVPRRAAPETQLEYLTLDWHHISWKITASLVELRGRLGDKLSGAEVYPFNTDRKMDVGAAIHGLRLFTS